VALDHRAQRLRADRRVDVVGRDAALLVAADAPGRVGDEAADVGLPLRRQVVALAEERGGQEQHVLVGIDHADDAGQRQAQLEPRLPCPVKVGGRRLAHVRERQVDEAVDECPLVVEVEVHRGARDERAPRDHVHPQVLERDLLEHLAAGFEDRVLGRVARLQRLYLCASGDRAHR